MSLLSYQLLIKRYQRELGLSDRDFNKLDYEHSNVNLIKHLQILNPVITASAPPPSPGWYGNFLIFNSYTSTQQIYLTVEADTNGTIVELYPFCSIQIDNYITVSVSQQNRLTSSSTIIKITFSIDNDGVIFQNYFTGLTLDPNSPKLEYNLTVDSAYIDGVSIDWEVVIAG